MATLQDEIPKEKDAKWLMENVVVPLATTLQVYKNKKEGIESTEFKNLPAKSLRKYMEKTKFVERRKIYYTWGEDNPRRVKSRVTANVQPKTAGLILDPDIDELDSKRLLEIISTFLEEIEIKTFEELGKLKKKELYKFLSERFYWEMLHLIRPPSLSKKIENIKDDAEQPQQPAPVHEKLKKKGLGSGSSGGFWGGGGGGGGFPGKRAHDEEKFQFEKQKWEKDQKRLDEDRERRIREEDRVRERRKRDEDRKDARSALEDEVRDTTLRKQIETAAESSGYRADPRLKGMRRTAEEERLNSVIENLRGLRQQQQIRVEQLLLNLENGKEQRDALVARVNAENSAKTASAKVEELKSKFTLETQAQRSLFELETLERQGRATEAEVISKQQHIKTLQLQNQELRAKMGRDAERFQGEMEKSRIELEKKQRDAETGKSQWFLGQAHLQAVKDIVMSEEDRSRLLEQGADEDVAMIGTLEKKLEAIENYHQSRQSRAIESMTNEWKLSDQNPDFKWVEPNLDLQEQLALMDVKKEIVKSKTALALAQKLQYDAEEKAEDARTRSNRDNIRFSHKNLKATELNTKFDDLKVKDKKSLSQQGLHDLKMLTRAKQQSIDAKFGAKQAAELAEQDEETWWGTYRNDQNNWTLPHLTIPELEERVSSTGDKRYVLALRNRLQRTELQTIMADERKIAMKDMLKAEARREVEGLVDAYRNDWKPQQGSPEERVSQLAAENRRFLDERSRLEHELENEKHGRLENERLVRECEIKLQNCEIERGRLRDFLRDKRLLGEFRNEEKDQEDDSDEPDTGGSKYTGDGPGGGPKRYSSREPPRDDDNSPPPPRKQQTREQGGMTQTDGPVNVNVSVNTAADPARQSFPAPDSPEIQEQQRRLPAPDLPTDDPNYQRYTEIQTDPQRARRLSETMQMERTAKEKAQEATLEKLEDDQPTFETPESSPDPQRRGVQFEQHETNAPREGPRLAARTIQQIEATKEHVQVAGRDVQRSDSPSSGELLISKRRVTFEEQSARQSELSALKKSQELDKHFLEQEKARVQKIETKEDLARQIELQEIKVTEHKARVLESSMEKEDIQRRLSEKRQQQAQSGVDKQQNQNLQDVKNQLDAERESYRKKQNEKNKQFQDQLDHARKRGDKSAVRHLETGAELQNRIEETQKALEDAEDRGELLNLSQTLEHPTQERLSTLDDWSRNAPQFNPMKQQFYQREMADEFEKFFPAKLLAKDELKARNDLLQQMLHKTRNTTLARGERVSLIESRDRRLRKLDKQLVTTATQGGRHLANDLLKVLNWDRDRRKQITFAGTPTHLSIAQQHVPMLDNALRDQSLLGIEQRYLGTAKQVEQAILIDQQRSKQKLEEEGRRRDYEHKMFQESQRLDLEKRAAQQYQHRQLVEHSVAETRAFVLDKEREGAQSRAQLSQSYEHKIANRERLFHDQLKTAETELAQREEALRQLKEGTFREAEQSVKRNIIADPPMVEERGQLRRTEDYPGTPIPGGDTTFMQTPSGSIHESVLFADTPADSPQRGRALALLPVDRASQADWDRDYNSLGSRFTTAKNILQYSVRQDPGLDEELDIAEYDLDSSFKRNPQQTLLMLEDKVKHLESLDADEEDALISTSPPKLFSPAARVGHPSDQGLTMHTTPYGSKVHTAPVEDRFKQEHDRVWPDYHALKNEADRLVQRDEKLKQNLQAIDDTYWGNKEPERTLQQLKHFVINLKFEDARQQADRLANSAALRKTISSLEADFAERPNEGNLQRMLDFVSKGSAGRTRNVFFQLKPKPTPATHPKEADIQTVRYIPRTEGTLTPAFAQKLDFSETPALRTRQTEGTPEQRGLPGVEQNPNTVKENIKHKVQSDIRRLPGLEQHNVSNTDFNSIISKYERTFKGPIDLSKPSTQNDLKQLIGMRITQPYFSKVTGPIVKKWSGLYPRELAGKILKKYKEGIKRLKPQLDTKTMDALNTLTKDGIQQFYIPWLYIEGNVPHRDERTMVTEFARSVENSALATKMGLSKSRMLESGSKAGKVRKVRSGQGPSKKPETVRESGARPAAKRKINVGGRTVVTQTTPARQGTLRNITSRFSSSSPTQSLFRPPGGSEI